MKDVQKLVGLQGVQVEPVRANELERVPGLRIVARRDRDSAFGFEPTDRELKARRRADAEVNHLAARREQSRKNGRANHRPRGPRVAADEYPARVEVRPERLREAYRKLRREGLADEP